MFTGNHFKGGKYILIIMKKLLDIFIKKSYIFMLAGMIVLVAGIILFYRIKNGIPGNVVLAWGISGVGLVLYLSGRIGAILNRRNRTR